MTKKSKTMSNKNMQNNVSVLFILLEPTNSGDVAITNLTWLSVKCRRNFISAVNDLRD